MIHNPIIRGFNPDPSVCYAEGTYYVINSTFEYFPGLPIWESKDLVNWSYCDSVLTDTDHLNLAECENNQGLYAPTIRFQKGVFYVVNTNKYTKENFIVSSPSIHGPWTMPSFIAKNGIDPSLLFLEDGRCFYCSNGRDHQGRQGIFGQFINPQTGELHGEMRLLTYGCGGHSTEGPHIYQIGGYYYLLISEGGTGTGHHICFLRSKEIFGPYIPGSHNPALSHAQRKGHEIQSTGHADLLLTPEGDWYAVFLATRNASKQTGRNLGRETFLAPVTFKDGWPVIGNNGFVELSMAGGYAELASRDHFSLSFGKDLSLYPVLKVRAPHEENYLLDKEGKRLTLKGTCPIGKHLGHPTLLAIRQTEFVSSFHALLDVESLEQEAGIALLHNSNYYYALTVQKEGELMRVSLDRMVHGHLSRNESILVDAQKSASLSILSDRKWYTFLLGKTVIAKAPIYAMSNTTSFDGSFTGALYAIFAVGGKATFLDGMEMETVEDDWVMPVMDTNSWI